MEQSQTDNYLCSKNYGWIVYIKLFNNIPFIIGKTGTGLVSNSPIDFDFLIGDSKDIARNGLGRTFIRENYPNITYTDFDYVLIKSCKNESEALSLEYNLGIKYNLFFS